MKKVLFLSLLLCLFHFSSFAQEQETENKTVEIGPAWLAIGYGGGNTVTPFLVNDEGQTLGDGLVSVCVSAQMMYDLPKSLFSVGLLASIHSFRDITFESEDYTPTLFRLYAIPSISMKKVLWQRHEISLMTGAGLKWNRHSNDLPSGYHYCQKEFSPVGSLTASYVYRPKFLLSNGVGIRGTLYSYGNTTGVNVKSPLIDAWEIAVCYYFSDF